MPGDIGGLGDVLGCRQGIEIKLAEYGGYIVNKRVSF